MNRIFITICLALVAMATNAQTITDELRRDQQGQGKVIINHSAEIERLVNNPQHNTTTQNPANKQDITGNPTIERNPTQHPTDTRSAEHNATERPADRQTTPRTTTERPTGNDYEATTVNTNKKIMRHSYKTTGYRIQVYTGGNKRTDRTKCEEIAARLKASFPEQPIYVHFYTPSWKCRMGNFTSMEEAKSVLSQVRKMGYNQACIVKGTINVQY